MLLPPKVPLPVRPRDVSVDGRDPCSVLTPALATRLGFDRNPGPNTIQFLNSAPACTVSQNLRAEVLTVVFATTVGGIDIFNRADVFAVDLRPLDVAGFPALLARPRQVESFCYVPVDIAAGETVIVQVDEGGRKPTTSQDRLCATAQRAASQVVQDILSG